MKNSAEKNDSLILKILSDGNFHSGENLGTQLGISRSAVWKHIKSLTEKNIEIEAVSNKGYRLLQNIELLNSTKILKEISIENQSHLNKLILLDGIGSTNDYLLQLI